MKELKDYFRKLDQVEKAIRKIPAQMTVIAVKFSKDRFVQQNWVDARTENWKGSRFSKRGKAINVGRSLLKRSIRRTRIGKDYAAIGSELPYAQIRNEGGKIPITKKMRKYFWSQYHKTKDDKWKYMALTKKKYITVPRNQFIGDSDQLTKLIERQVLSGMTKALK